MVATLEVIGGLVLCLIIFYDLFQSVVLPRPAVNKFALVRFVLRRIWVGWRWLGNRMSSISRRETWLAAFGPVGVLTMFGLWGLALVLGYSLLIDGLRDQIHPPPANFGTSLYFSATTLVPLSYGDLVPIGEGARFVIFAESATGVILAALAITLLFSLYGSFQAREESVVTLDAIAGAPPSGVQLLENAAERGMHEELVSTFDEWRKWSAMVLESHLAYPILLFFRSSHDNEAWLNSFGAVERSEFDQARERLGKAGYRCHGSEDAWKEFARLRSRYASPLNQLAQQLSIIPAQWIGDRTYLPHLERAGRGRRRRREK